MELTSSLLISGANPILWGCKMTVSAGNISLPHILLRACSLLSNLKMRQKSESEEEKAVYQTSSSGRWLYVVSL